MSRINEKKKQKKLNKLYKMKKVGGYLFKNKNIFFFNLYFSIIEFFG